MYVLFCCKFLRVKNVPLIPLCVWSICLFTSSRVIINSIVRLLFLTFVIFHVMSNLSTSGVTWYMIGGLGASEIKRNKKFYEKEILPLLHILKNQSMHSYKLSQIYNFIESTSHPPCFFNHEEKLAKKDAVSLSILFAKHEFWTFFISISKETVAFYLQIWNILIWYQAAPLMFVALQEYEPKSPAVLGLSVSVPILCAEFTPCTIRWPSLNQVKFARGSASAEHLRVVTFPIHDWNNGFEEAVLLMRGLSEHRVERKSFQLVLCLGIYVWVTSESLPHSCGCLHVPRWYVWFLNALVRVSQFEPLITDFPCHFFSIS